MLHDTYAHIAVSQLHLHSHILPAKSFFFQPEKNLSYNWQTKKVILVSMRDIILQNVGRDSFLGMLHN